MGVNAFVLGLAGDLEQRTQRLLDLLTEHRPHPDIAEFSQSVLDRLRWTVEDLHALTSSDLISHRPLWPYALSQYQDLFQNVALVETFAIPILLRYDDRDHQCQQLVAVMASEMRYPPELTPVVTATSDQYYYWAQPELRVIGVPVGDLGGILGWPDLVHELSHLLLEARPGFLKGFTPVVNQHFQKERDLLADIGGFEQDNKWLAVAQIKWGEKQEGTWRVELAADLMATYFMGPSYGWQHIRLAMNHGSDPYHPIPGYVEEHPADQARLDAVLEMLQLLNLKDDISKISNRWSEMLEIELQEQRPQGYDLYYPEKLLKKLARIVFAGCQAEGLVPFTEQQHRTNPSLVALVNQAWQVFNQDPVTYPAWELRAIGRLKRSLSGMHGN
jgi:hypothetical protein